MTFVAPLITSNPQTLTGGTYANLAATINGRRWRLVVTPTLASTAFVGGVFHVIFGQTNGGLAFVDASIELDDNTDALMINRALTWSAGQALTFTVEMRSGIRSLTIAGATTGNGTFTISNANPIIDPAQDLTIGNVPPGNVPFAGTVSSFDDTAPDMSWVGQMPPLPSRRIASAALLVAGLVAPPIVPAPVAPPLSWEPVVPAHQLRRAAPPLNIGGEFAPTTIVPPPAAPPMSWTPQYPDIVPRARAPLNVGGTTGPEAVIPQPPTPGLSWLPQYPDILNRPRHPIHAAAGLVAPPFAGGKSLTVGAAAIRQNILSQLAFSTPLTTFGTDLTFTAAGNTLTTGTHGMIVTAGPFQLRTTGTLPAGSDASTLYYMITPSASTVQLALTAALAKTGTAITLTDAGTGTHTLVRAVNTAPLYSTLVAIFARGTQAASPNQATDSFGNTYSYIASAPRVYDNFNTSSLSIATSFRSKGGNAHTWSASIGNIGGQQDEVVIAGLEIFNALILQSSSVVEIADGTQTTLTSGSVTTTAKALLVAVVGGNGNVNQDHVFTTPAGYTRIPQACAEGDPSAAGYIQIEVFVRLVDIKGTYNYKTQGTVAAGPGPEGAMLWHMAFQAQATDLQPLDWLYRQDEIPRRARRVLEAGETAPPRQPVPAAPLLSWTPVFPDATARVGRLQLSGETAPPFGDAAKLLAWLPNAIEPTRQRRVAPSGETAPPGNFAPAPWWPVYPDWTPGARPRIQGGETAPAFAPPAVPSISSWAPTFRDALVHAVIRQSAGETAPTMLVPLAPVPPASSWMQQPAVPVPRALRSPSGEAVGPVLTIPQPPAGPPLVLRASLAVANALFGTLSQQGATVIEIIGAVSVYQGDTLDLVLAVTDDAGQPFDLTGATVEVQVKEAAGAPDPALIAKSVGSGIVLLDQTTDKGKAVCSFSSVDTARTPQAYTIDAVVQIGPRRQHVVAPRAFGVLPVVNAP